MNLSTNCTVDLYTWRWRVSSLGVELVTCVFGAVGCAISLCCLKNCGKIQQAMKIQMLLIFTVSFVVCLVALPGHAITNYGTFLCWEGNAALAFLILYTTSVNLVRIYLTILAIYRFLAVCFPIRYMKFSHWRVVTGVNISLTVCQALSWITFFAVQDYTKVDINNPSNYYMGKALYSFFLVVPFATTITAYVAMVLLMLYRKLCVKHTQGTNSQDHIAMSVSILILMNLLLDVPHLAVHLKGIHSEDISFIVVHMVYRLRFVFDSFLFVGLNVSYRQKVLRYVSSRLLQRDVDTGFSDAVYVPSSDAKVHLKIRGRTSQST